MQPLLSIEHILKYQKKGFRNQEEYMKYLLKTCVYHTKFQDVSEMNTGMGGVNVGTDASELFDRWTRDGLPQLIQTVRFDKVFNQVVRHMQKYKDGGFRNYIPSTNFLEVMSQIDLDLPMKIIDRDFNGYFEISGRVKDDDGIPALWALVSLEVRLGRRYLSVTVFPEDMAPRHLMMGVQGEKISDLYNQLEDVKFGLGNTTTQGLDYNKAPFTKQLMNMVAYCVGPNEDFVQQFNKFSTSNKIKQVQEQQYTSKPYIPIGEGIERLRVQAVGETTVRAFPRWQRCGQGLQEYKLVFVREHTRQYKKDLTGEE